MKSFEWERRRALGEHQQRISRLAIEKENEMQDEMTMDRVRFGVLANIGYWYKRKMIKNYEQSHLSTTMFGSMP